jgi:uncharacterized protein
MWSARKVDDEYIVSIEDKTSIVDALTDFVTKKEITAGEISGLGAVNKAILRYFDPATKQYVDKTFSEQMEISNLVGNISVSEGEPLLHLHITLGRSDYSAIAGHLMDANVRGACELFVRPLNTVAKKIFKPEIGLKFYDF